jgi:hypothetical protein
MAFRSFRGVVIAETMRGDDGSNYFADLESERPFPSTQELVSNLAVLTV